MNQYYDEEENRGSSEDERSTFCPTDHSTFEIAVKFENECYEEEERRALSEDEKDMQHDAELLAQEGNYGAQIGDDGNGRGDCEGGCDEDAGFGDDDAGTRDLDDYSNGDAYYYDVAAAGFDDGYDDDGGDGADG